ncbi:aspartic peptidase domain-containing protein [Scleroderma yunnanense]
MVVINSVPFTTHLRVEKYGAKELLERDRARISNMLFTWASQEGPFAFRKTTGADEGSLHSVDVTNSGLAYTMSVGVGQPPTDYTLLVDTGSAITWIGANLKKPYSPTDTSEDTSDSVQCSYGSGWMKGDLYTDTVTLSPDLVIKKQSIGIARSTKGIRDVDGILGVGPADLSKGKVKPGGRKLPTVTDNLYSEGTIPTDSLGIFYAPLTKVGEITGELTFGGVDETKITSDVNYVPLTTTAPASQYWGINQSITYGDTTILDNASGFVDTGATFLLLTTSVFNAYRDAIGAYVDGATGLLAITEEQYNNLHSLIFHIGDVEYEFTPNAQIWPRALNSVLRGRSDRIYLVVAEFKPVRGSESIHFVNGFVWLQRFYTVYDTTNAEVGFATTPFTDAETN